MSTFQHTDVSIREKTTAVAEVAPRGAVVAEARVETRAGEKFAEAHDEQRKVIEAAACKANAHEEHETARPGAHAAAVFSDIGTKISAKRDASKAGHDLEKHEQTAVSEVQRAHDESIESKEKARLEALREAEAKAALTNRSTIVSEFATAHEIVAVAEVPARGATIGTGEAVSHADDHLVRAQQERVLAEKAAIEKADAEARLAAAHPLGEAKASVGGIGSKIHGKLHETKEWFSEKIHGKHADSKEADAEATLARDKELARQKALAAAEAEAARLDRETRATIIDEHTTTSTVVNSTHA